MAARLTKQTIVHHSIAHGFLHCMAEEQRIEPRSGVVQLSHASKPCSRFMVRSSATDEIFGESCFVQRSIDKKKCFSQ